jgi:ADP-ribose pyrophosphatase YjhB (NUDIX family)
MNSQQIHPAQGSILRTLRYTHSAWYSDIRRPSGFESDVFKFHLRSVIKAGYVEKLLNGEYALTAFGKEFANNFDDKSLHTQKQPKLSVRLIISKQAANGQTLYLFQRRSRNPYLDYWGDVGGPVQWGEAAEETASKELFKQTGLTADCTVRTFFRIRDYDQDSRQLFEDKFFIIVETSNLRGELSNEWQGGFNKWMTIDEFKSTQKHYDSCYEYIESVKNNISYTAQDLFYKREDY